MLGQYCSDGGADNNKTHAHVHTELCCVRPAGQKRKNDVYKCAHSHTFRNSTASQHRTTIFLSARPSEQSWPSMSQRDKHGSGPPCIYLSPLAYLPCHILMPKINWKNEGKIINIWYHLKRCLYHNRCLYNYFYTIERHVFTASKKHLEGSFEIV